MFAIAALAMFAGVRLLWQQQTKLATLDMGRYLAGLERTGTGPSRENLRESFREFTAHGDRTTSQPVGLRSEVGGYRLVEVRVSPSHATIVQLVNDSGKDVFALFVAPRAASLKFGKYHLVSTDLNGLHCLLVECHRQDVYVLTTGVRQYVFVRQHNSFADSEQLFKTVIQVSP